MISLSYRYFSYLPAINQWSGADYFVFLSWFINFLIYGNDAVNIFEHNDEIASAVIQEVILESSHHQ